MIDDHLLRYNKNQKYLMYDFETCNLNLVHKKNVPWELAWRLTTLDRVIEEREYLIKWPEIPISNDAAMITGFWAKQPKLELAGKDPAFVLREFEKHLYDPSVISIAHNGLGFDIFIHNTFRKLLGMKSDYSYVDRMIDTNVIARGVKINAPFPKDRADLLSYQLKMYANPVKGVKTSIKALCAEFDIEYDVTKAHDALYDVGLLDKIFKIMIWKAEI